MDEHIVTSLHHLATVELATAGAVLERLTAAYPGLVVRRRGSGNYIAPRIEQPLSNLSSFSEQLQQRGYTPNSHWLKREVVAADGDEQLALGLSPGARVARPGVCGRGRGASRRNGSGRGREHLELPGSLTSKAEAARAVGKCGLP